METFGERLKYFRKHILKMSRNEFSSFLNISASSIEAWECNRMNISRSKQELLTFKFEEQKIQVNYDWLFLGTGIWSTPNLKINSEKTKDNVSKNILYYHISTYNYEPLLKKNSILKLKKTSLHSINFPALLAYNDKENNFYFGFSFLVKFDQPLFYCYTGSIQIFTLKEDDDIYQIISYKEP